MGKQLEKDQLWLPPAPPCGGHPIKGGGKIACRLELKTWVFVKSSTSIQVQLQELVKGVEETAFESIQSYIQVQLTELVRGGAGMRDLDTKVEDFGVCRNRASIHCSHEKHEGYRDLVKGAEEAAFESLQLHTSAA